MTEKEFIALLAIEGKTLDVGKATWRLGDEVKEGYVAEVNRKLIDFYASSDFKIRRRDAVQDVIKKYYNRADN